MAAARNDAGGRPPPPIRIGPQPCAQSRLRNFAGRAISGRGTDVTRMQKPITEPAKRARKARTKTPAKPAAIAQPATPAAKAPAGEAAVRSAVDIEAFAHNVARMIEEGGKALAAYMKPREEGKIKDELAEDVADVVKTVGQVAEYWLSDPAARGRTADEPRPRLSRSVGGHGQTHGRRRRRPDGRARPEGQALCRSGMVAEPVLRFPQAGLSAHCAMGRPAGQGRRRHRRAHAAEGRVLRQADRQRDLAVEFRASPIRNCCARRSPPMPRTSCAACTCSPRTSRPAKAISRSASPIHRVRGRPQSRAHARQGDLPERTDPVDPVRGDHARRCSRCRC